VWAVAAGAELPDSSAGDVPNLSEPVRVLFDDRGVPHIFARTRLDAIRALGYVVARDRLFQLEIQAKAGAGRLTELLGPSVLPLDRETRRLGLPDAAELNFEAAKRAPDGVDALNAYAAGINAWIDHLRPSDVPLEYHLLGRRPARWRPIDAIHLTNRMGYTLAFNGDDLTHEEAAAAVGRAAADALFPVNSPIQEPIQPNGSGVARFDFTRLPPPGQAESDLLSGAFTEESDAIGSNNWAVMPSRTANHRTLLAGDPHLQLTLPSIWYEAHIVVPDSLDVYGVTIPGLPFIILGFNRDVAWSFTNTESDVLDRYVESVDDSTRPERYLVDGKWRPLRIRFDKYYGPGMSVLATDTLRFTHRGPLSLISGRWMSTRWTVLESPMQPGLLLGAAAAGNVAEWQRAMAPYAVPAQNMIVADREGHIAIRSTGRFPIRPGDGRGDLLRDGSTSGADWLGDWPLESYPAANDPRQGYLASANQQPIDPRLSPRYLGSNWYAPWRALRINQLLRADSAATPEAMMRYQTDPGSPRADLFVPALVAAGRKADDPEPRKAAELLAGWDRRYTRENTRAVLFEAAMDELSRRTWDELGAGPRPTSAILAQLLADSSSAWWDDHWTTPVERRDEILRTALGAALRNTVSALGEPDGDRWRWDRNRHANIYHLLRIPALSALGLPIEGGTSTINPSSGGGEEGASWRMVVELGPEVRAWGTYPGGQSGNPASSRYLDRLPRWLEGKLDTLRVPRSEADLRGHVRSVLTLESAR
jgi:penicillin amidase